MTKNALTSESDNNLGTPIHPNGQQANQAITSGPKRCIMKQLNKRTALRQFWFIIELLAEPLKFLQR
jgi:hypothetical protein